MENNKGKYTLVNICIRNFGGHKADVYIGKTIYGFGS